MAVVCPNRNTEEWKYLVEKLGNEDEAMKFFMANGEVLPGMPELTKMFQTKSIYDGNIDLEAKKAQFGPVKKVKDLTEYFKNNTASVKSFEQFSEDEFANGLLSTIRTSSGVFSYAGKNWDFSTSSDAQIIDIIKKEILPDMKSFEEEHKKRLVEWINRGRNPNELANFFPGKVAGVSKFSDNTIDTLTEEYLKPNINTKFFLYSDLKDNKELQQLGIPYDEVFEGYNPIIAVHVTPQGEINLSILDTTTMPLSQAGINQKGNNLFSNFGYGDYKAYLNAIPLQNSESGIREFYVGLLAMRLKHSNKSINIKDVAVLGLTRKGVIPRPVMIQNDFIPAVQAIRNIKSFMDLIPESIKRILTNKNLDRGKFDQPFISSYRAFLVSEKDKKLNMHQGNDLYVIYEKSAINTIDSFLQNNTPVAEFIDMLKNRMHMIESSNSTKGLLTNEEYINIAEILKYMRYSNQDKTLEKNSTQDTSWMGAMLKNLFDVQSDIVQWARNEIGRGLSYVTEKLFAFKKEHAEKIKKLAEALQGSAYWNITQKTKERFLDSGGDRFKRLFKRRKALMDGNTTEVEITTNEIHWNLNDPETKRAISSGELTKAEVEYGAWIVEKIKTMYIDLIMHENRFSYNMQKLSKEKRLEKAKERYAAEWKDGLIPVVQKSFSEKIASLEGKGGIKQLFREMGNMDMLYHDQEYSEKSESFGEVFNGFMSELGSTMMGSHKSYLGSSERLKKMGLAYEVTGQLKVIDLDMNKNVSTNLENIMDYFMLMGIRKIKLDTDVLPMVNAARCLLFALDKDQTNNTKVLTVMVDRLVHGIKQKDTPLGIDFDPTVNTALAIVTFNGLALNVPLWAASFLMNQSQAWTFAISNGLSKNGKFFTQKEAAEAMGKIVSNPKEFNKMLAIMQFYQVADMTEKDLANHPRHKIFGKQLGQSHFMHWGGWATDYTARGWIMMSQMIFDGSWDAHIVDEAGNVTYDEKKDKRFYKNGKATEDGKMLMSAIKAKAVEDGSEEPDTPLTRGYNYDYAKQFKYIADKYIIGGMDHTTYGAIESVFWGRMLMQFKRYLPAKFMNAFGRRVVSNVASTPQIYINDQGEKVVRWTGNIAEGYFFTMLRLATQLRQMKEMGLNQYWKQLKPEEKYNMAKMAMDLAMFAILWGLYNGLTADWDDDEKEDFLKDSRMLRTFKYAGLDLLPFAPWTILKSVDNPMPIVDQALRLFNIAVGDTREWERAVPFTASYQVIEETFGEPEE